MTEIEKELIELIRKSENPQQSLIKAIKIITNFLAQPLSSEELTPFEHPAPV